MSKNKILVVDDQMGIRLLLTDILENEGYEVQEATTGKQALDKIHKTNFDLIILDYKLPIMDGAEVLQKMEEDGVEVPALIMSGLTESIGAEAKKFPLVKKVIAKPFNVQELIQLVNKLV
ncbi:response regulator [Oceanobacillus salinisoli]|uniref:response regulator n=1 Tax=Oceanobacillus salinisoli TaxID=2678611 RepID=UPI0012E13F95|nr:response regulator [Oceanobacillus salinisoli]